MILSRRSFLKMAGLTTVAAAGASMFTGCGAFSTTPIKVVAAKDSTKEFQAAVTKLNEKKLVVWPADANGAYLNSFLMSNLTANGLSNFAVEKAEYKTVKDEKTGKESKYLEVTVKSTAK
jgi:Tat pathway signal sequence domain protein